MKLPFSPVILMSAGAIIVAVMVFYPVDGGANIGRVMMGVGGALHLLSVYKK